MTINKTLYGIADTFLIESVNISPADSNSLNYSVTALDGASIGGWEEFFKELLKSGRDFYIQENEVLILLNNITEENSVEGSINIEICNALYPADDLYPAEDLYPNILVLSEVDVND